MTAYTKIAKDHTTAFKPTSFKASFKTLIYSPLFTIYLSPIPTLFSSILKSETCKIPAHTKTLIHYIHKTYGLRRCELPFKITSTPPRPAAAMTACLAPKSTPTTLISLCYLLVICNASFAKLCGCAKCTTLVYHFGDSPRLYRNHPNELIHVQRN